MPTAGGLTVRDRPPTRLRLLRFLASQQALPLLFSLRKVPVSWAPGSAATARDFCT